MMHGQQNVKKTEPLSNHIYGVIRDAAHYACWITFRSEKCGWMMNLGPCYDDVPDDVQGSDSQVYSYSYIRHNLSLSEHLNSQVVTPNLKQRIWNTCMKSTVLLYHVLLLMTTNHATAGQERRKGSARVPATDSSLSKIRLFPSHILTQFLTYEHSAHGTC